MVLVKRVRNLNLKTGVGYSRMFFVVFLLYLLVKTDVQLHCNTKKQTLKKPSNIQSVEINCKKYTPSFSETGLDKTNNKSDSTQYSEMKPERLERTKNKQGFI